MEKDEIRESKDDGKLIRISKEADVALLALLKRLNESEGQVRVTKSALASYLIERFQAKFSDEDFSDLYMRSVSEVDLLRRAYKQAVESGVIPDNLREILLSNVGLTPGPKKVKKARQKDGSIAITDETEAV